MDRKQLYDRLAERKIKPKDFEPYAGDNGRVNRCVSLFRRGDLRTGGVLVDVGGGIGDLGFAVRDLFDKTVVVDISEENLKAARAKGNWTMYADVDLVGLKHSINPPSGVEIVCQNFVLDESAEVITALDFIEHIVDPENFARECFRLLKPGGQVFINTPNIEFWRHLESQVVHGIFPHTSGDREVYHGGHLAFYNLHDMKTIFEAAGFVGSEQIKDEEGYSDPPGKWMGFREFTTQDDYYLQCLRLGCPNLLFKCVKP